MKYKEVIFKSEIWCFRGSDWVDCRIFCHDTVYSGVVVIKMVLEKPAAA